MIIEQFSRNLFLDRSNAEKRAQAIRFFYVREENVINFADCCSAIDPTIRPGVILLRMNYELWKRWIVFSGPLPEDAAEPPTEAELRASAVADEEGTLIAREVWYQAGIGSAELLRRCEFLMPQAKHKLIQPALTLLNERHVLSFAGPDHWYLTGRNPMLEAGDRQKENKGRNMSLAGSLAWTSLF